MNPSVDPAVIARAYEDDPIAAAAEWGGAFRRDVEAFLTPEALAAVTVPDRHELPPAVGVSYVAFADPSGGSQDSFTLAIAHSNPDGTAVLDLVRERRAPFDPDPVVAEFAEVLASYGVRAVIGDRYAGEWVIERFREHGVEYRTAELTKSGLYRELLPAINGGRVALLDNQRLRAQLEGLERRVARGGKDSIDHAPGGKDDVANAVAGVLVAALPLGAAFNMSGIGNMIGEVNDEMRTRGGMYLGDMPPEADLPSRDSLGLSRPISPGFTDFHDRRRW